MSALGVDTYQKRYCYQAIPAVVGVKTYQSNTFFGRC